LKIIDKSPNFDEDGMEAMIVWKRIDLDVFDGEQGVP
jgi:hypothetical protein